MDMWDILGIEVTCDLSIIKKAYAKKLKVHHPEDDPTGFQSLKEAYDSAVQYAKYMKMLESSSSDLHADQDFHETSHVLESNSPIKENYTIQNNVLWINEQFDNQNAAEFTINGFESDARAASSITFENIAPALSFDWDKANDDFIKQMEDIYGDFFARISLDNWAELLNKDVMWDIENRSILEPRVLEFLSSHYYLPQNIWKLLDQCFSLREREEELRSEYNIPFAKHVVKLLNQSIPLTYSFIQKVEGNQYEHYFELKENTYDFIEDEDPKAAEFNLNKAKKLCSSDPDLIRMEGIISFQMGKLDNALKLLNQALSFNPNDMEALYYRAYIFYANNQFATALKDLDRNIHILPPHHKSLLLAAKCHLELDDTFVAKDLVTQAFIMKPEDKDTQETLLQIDRKLKVRLWVRVFLKPWKLRDTIRQLLSLYKITKKKFTSQTLIYLFAKFCKWGLYALIFVFCIIIAVATKAGAIIFIFYLIRKIASRKEK